MSSKNPDSLSFFALFTVVCWASSVNLVDSLVIITILLGRGGRSENYFSLRDDWLRLASASNSIGGRDILAHNGWSFSKGHFRYICCLTEEFDENIGGQVR